MNAADLHKLPAPEEILSRINYNRSKTKSRRDDEAFMSVHIPQVAIPLYKKYAGKLKLKYTTHITLDQALSKGMKGLRKLVGIPDLDFYDLRHAFGDWARNELNFHKDDVAEALNHKDPKYAVTDIYMSRSWKIIDNIQKEVIGYLNSDKVLLAQNILQIDQRDMFNIF
jgi:integrase